MWLYNEEELKRDRCWNNNRPYQQCSMSLMDTIADPGISFDENGISNYFYEYQQAADMHVLSGDEGNRKVFQIIEFLKENGKGKKYDCLLGISGGVDSTYLALKAKEFGLRLLCVHFDNGWNSELAVMNIQNIIQKLGFDLYSYVIDWDEFKDIQLAYFNSNVIDLEAVTDIAIFSALDSICKKFGIKYIIDGRNIVTESTLPKAWICKDPENLKDIHKRFGSIPLKSYPLPGRVVSSIRQIKKKRNSIQLLNFLPYNKAKAKIEIIEQLNWKDYGGKHYESIFTRFYQGYILPNKFKVDKRKAHLSNLIFSNQLSKVEAINELNMPIYDEIQLAEDFEFVQKKLELTREWLLSYIQKPGVNHSKFASSKKLSEYYPILKLIKPIYRKFI